MTGTQTVMLVAAIGAFATIIAGLFSYIAARHTAKTTYERHVFTTFTEAAKQQDEHWARYTDALQRRLEGQDKLISDNAKRIEAAELRSEAAEVRASKSEHLYSMAIIYLRRVIRWINDNLPGEDYPPPPPELNLDL